MLVLYCLTADGGAVPSCFHAVVHEAGRPAATQRLGFL